MIASHKGNTGIATLLIERKAAIDEGRYGVIPLMIALQQGNADIATLLIERKAAIDEGRRGVTPLRAALEQGNTRQGAHLGKQFCRVGFQLISAISYCVYIIFGYFFISLQCANPISHFTSICS